MLDQAQDAAFFQRVHDLMHLDHVAGVAGEAPQVLERSRERRSSYPHVQLMAPYDGAHLPTQGEFRRVQFHDISTAEFSFFDSPLPSYRHVVALLGPLPFQAFTAEVRRVEMTADPAIFLIGCRILARITT